MRFNELIKSGLYSNIAVKNQLGTIKTPIIRCTAFGPKATFAENYLAKGMKIEVSGNLRTGSYVKDGQTINTFELIVNDQEFAESKKKNAEIFASGTESERDFGDAELPFN